jgi:hypothetical protein
MIGTPHLHRLTELAANNHWRLALVGDPRQLQAFGRGGMFTELCNTTRTVELEHVHRFTDPWEAEASLLLRQGDARALDLYEAHGRIRAGTLSEHLDHFATTWITNHDHGDTTALMASTNQHVDAINHHVQTVRRQLGHTRHSHAVPIAGGETADIGDVVATRRNHRHLTTSTGEQVRNRDLWTVTASHRNGDLTLTPIAGNASITLSATYVAEHVRLGYAATEMGTQSDTVTTGLELASNATSCRNLYVAMTRGRSNNTVCVITDTHHIADARDVLDTIITIDRAGTPATAQRRNLATQDHQPQVAPLQPRFQIPDWLQPLRDATAGQLADATDSKERDQHQRARINQEVVLAEQRHQQARDTAAPFEQAVSRTADANTAARVRRDSLAEQLANARRRDRKLLRSELITAEHDLAYTEIARSDALQAATPARDALAETADALRAARRNERNHQLLDQRGGPSERLEHLSHRLEALDTWRKWAEGQKVTPERLEHAAIALDADAVRIPELRALRGKMTPQPAVSRHHVAPELALD